MLMDLLKGDDDKIFDLFHKIYSESVDLSSPLDSKGSTALHIVVKGAGLSLCKAYHLLRHCKFNDSFINATDDMGRTPLHWAALAGNSNLIYLLIHNKADLSIKDTDGNTPIHLVCKGKDLVSFSLLLAATKNKSFSSIKNNRGHFFSDHFSTPAQLLIYKRFIKPSNRHVRNQIIKTAKKDPKLIVALIALNDLEAVKTISDSQNSPSYSRITELDFIPSPEMQSILKYNNCSHPDKMIQFLKYSGLTVNEQLLCAFFKGNFNEIKPDELFAGIEGSGFNLFHFACTDFDKKTLSNLLNRHKSHLLVNTLQCLSCTNIEILEKCDPRLASNILKSLPQLYVLNASLLTEHEECSICREPNSFGDCWIKLKCRHKFHKNCLYSWTARQWTCPMCRRSIDIYGGLDIYFDRYH